jgi:hypothetical protein
MNAALFRKELRDLLPWGILGLALGLSNVAELLLEQVDLAPLGQTFRLLNEYNVVLYWVIAFAIGTGLAIREHDDRTLAFLDGLPVSRSRVFFVKCAVMSALVLIGPLLELVAIAMFHLLSRGSLDRELHGALLLQALVLQALLLVNGLMLGAAFGRLRSLGWAVAGLAATGLVLLVERVPRAALLNPLTLLDWEWTSAAIVVDGETVRTQLAVTALAALVAWQGFVRAGKVRRPLNLSGPIAGAVVVAATIGTAVAVFMVVMRPLEPSVSSTAPGGAGTYRFAPSPPAQTVTRHYRISYPAHEAEAALVLAAEADAVFERVHALLGLPPGDVINVDASGSAPNTHGTAFLGRLRMQLDSEVLAVLAHETAHVAAQRAAGAERDWLWQAASVLSEGLASWIETRFRARVERADERMLVLAAMHSRRELIVDELADPLLLQTVRDQNVKYAAGEALIAALVQLYGEDALARLLQAFDDPRLPSDLLGLPLWQSTFQLAGFDLAAVVDEFFRGIGDYAALHADRIAALPRPRVVLVRLDRAIGAMPVLDPPHTENPAAYEFVMRFRPAPDSPLTDYRQFPAVANQPVWPAARNMSGGRVCMQPGVRVGAEVLYEPWTCLPTSDAVDFNALRTEQNPPAADAR